MLCTHCGLWELTTGDLVCCWCGASYLRFAVSLEPAVLPAEDYPPPVTLRVRNDSPLGAITLERLDIAQRWITPLPGQALPQTLSPGMHGTFHLDVDTFAAGVERQATVGVTAQYAGQAQTASLRLQSLQAIPHTVPQPAGS